MTKTLYCFALGMAFVALARGEDKPARAADTSDQQFVLTASASGLAEVNLGNLAAKRASDPAVKEFGQHMVKDHTKANKELLKVANKKGYKVAGKMDAEHQKLFGKLSKARGSEFDTAYMDGQVKDHEEAVSLFEKESKGGKDEDLKALAKKTLPTLREHLKMAKEVRGKLKGGKGEKE